MSLTKGRTPTARDPTGSSLSDGEWAAWFCRAHTPIELGRLGAYELLGEIGHGAQGTVYKSRQHGTQRIIAIKRLAAGVFAGDRARARFEREVEAAAALAHPGIVTVFGTDSIDGQPVLLMEWVDGRSIDTWALKGDGRPTVRERLSLFADVCDAVSHAHQRGVLHRDLKPSNILIDRQGRPRVLDFGLAKLMGDVGTLSGIGGEGHGLLGTPAYAAPEQIRGDSNTVDTRADVYALGVVLYQMLAGRLPFEQTELPELLDAIRRQEPVRPSRLTPSLDDEIDAIVLTAMRKDKEERYQSADGLAADVRRYLSGQPVLAHPPSALYQFRKLVGRHRLVFGVTGIAIVIVAALAIVSSVLAARLGSRSRDLTSALAQARDERDRSAANAEFLSGMLDSLGRAITAGNARPAKAMLLDAKSQLDSGTLSGDPELEVSLWRRLAESSRRLGMIGETAEFTERAVALCQKRLPGGHPEAGRCKLIEGLRFEDRGDLASSESCYLESYQILTAALGEENVETARAASNLAIMKGLRGEFEESLQIHQQVLAIRTRLRGPIHADVAHSLCNIGVLMRSRKRYDDALDYLQQGLDVAMQAGPPTDHVVTKIRSNLARVARDQDRLEDADRLYRENLAALEAVHGDESGALIPALRPLAAIAARRGRPAEAVELATRVMTLTMRHSSAHDARIPAAQLSLADFLLKAHQPEAAEPLIRSASDLLTQCEPPSPKLAAQAKRLLANCGDSER